MSESYSQATVACALCAGIGCEACSGFGYMRTGLGTYTLMSQAALLAAVMQERDEWRERAREAMRRKAAAEKVSRTLIAAFEDVDALAEIVGVARQALESQ